MSVHQHSHSRNHGLDTLRAAAIILVFMYHYQAFVSGEATFGWGSTLGWVGVDLFFVLSGYLIGNQIFGGLARGSRFSPKAFYIRRLLRTLPAYYVVLALYFLLPDLMGGKTPPPLWRFLSFTQNIGLMPGTAFSHAWSLCIEEQFYLLLPAIVLLSLKLSRSVWHGWLLITVLMLAAIATRSLLWLEYGREVDDIRGYYPHIYYASICRFDEFLPGVAVALLKNAHPTRWQWLLQEGQRVLLLGVLATALVFRLMFEGYYIEGYGYGFAMTAIGYPAVATSFALLVVAAMSPQTALHRWRVPGAANLAAWSYAIYLVHKPIAVMLKNATAAQGLDATVLLLLITVASVLGGWLLYAAVETPFMRWRDHRWPSNFPATA